MKKLYSQNNITRRFQLEFEFSNLTQDNLSISDFYFTFMNLWTEYIDIIYASLSPEDLAIVQILHETSRRDQFLMKLRFDFDATCFSLMNHDLVSS